MWSIYAISAIVTAVGLYPLMDFSRDEEVVGFIVCILAGCALWGYIGSWLYICWRERTRRNA